MAKTFDKFLREELEDDPLFGEHGIFQQIYDILKDQNTEGEEAEDVTSGAGDILSLPETPDVRKLKEIIADIAPDAKSIESLRSITDQGTLKTLEKALTDFLQTLKQ